jgi:hypothetical protein
MEQLLEANGVDLLRMYSEEVTRLPREDQLSGSTRCAMRLDGLSELHHVGL